MSVWQSVHLKELWMEALNLPSSTCKLNCFPFSSLARVGSLWQARQSSLLIFAALAAFLGAAMAVAISNKVSATIQRWRFTKLLAFGQPRRWPFVFCDIGP